MPVLARTLEEAGLSTILLTNMPYWAEKVGVPRTLAVEFPFGQLLGQPGDSQQQTAVIREALRVLEEAEVPGSIVHSQLRWPIPAAQAIKDWQPAEPSPVIAALRPKFRQILRDNRRKKR